MTAEPFESTANINPQQIKHLSDHFISREGALHAVRLNVPMSGQTFRGGNLTELPVTLMVARDSGGMYTDTSANGLQEVLQRLAAVINDRHNSSAMNYQVEYTERTGQGEEAGDAGRARQSRWHSIEGLLRSVMSYAEGEWP